MASKNIDADQRITHDLEKLTTDLSGLVTGMVAICGYFMVSTSFAKLGTILLQCILLVHDALTYFMRSLCFYLLTNYFCYYKGSLGE